jgi:hypothetical protein
MNCHASETLTVSTNFYEAPKDSYIQSIPIVITSETSANFYETTRCNIPEDFHVQSIYSSPGRSY